MEQEIRKKFQLAYLNIWDDYPAPMYNKPYYEACDLLMGISKQTVNINKLVLKDLKKIQYLNIYLMVKTQYFSHIEDQT